MDITIERLDGTQYILSDYNISILDFKVDSPLPRFMWETIEDRDGLIDLGTTYAERTLKGTFEFVANDFDDFPLLRNEIFKLFDSRESFYLIDSREPGKRWLVKANGFSPDQVVISRGKFDLTFISPSSYAESIGTTLDALTFDLQEWQTGQGLTLDETMYTQTTSTFQIYNAADGVTVDPRIVPLLITFTGASTNLQIKNNTTGDVWSYTGTTNAGDEIELDGIRSTKNGLSIFRDTNHQFISIVPGYNDFQIVGASGSFTISFSFRFYTL
jgi:hypothetical protein